MNTQEQAAFDLMREALKKHHAQATRYTMAKRKANATCADFKTNSISELAEQAYMTGLGRETEEALAAAKEVSAGQVDAVEEVDAHAEFEEWWEKHGQYCRAGGGEYEKTFAWNAWLYQLVRLSEDAEPALAAANAVPKPTVHDNSQEWKGMDGTTAFHLITRHADGWADVGKMMGEWLAANAVSEVGINGLTEAETSASMSVMGLSKPTVQPQAQGEAL